MSETLSAFDTVADSYDGQFTRTTIGSLMREAVWARCAARFSRGSRVLEMNCGTGEDALWLAQYGVEVIATDVSAPMLRVARDKLSASPARAAARFEQLAWEDLDCFSEGEFDGALSNFGGLNCVADLRAAAKALATKLRPGAVAILCIMGPVVPWEWGWFLAHGNPKSAFRRLRRGGTTWSGMTIRYPSIRATRRAFSSDFRVLRVAAIGALMPPPYAGKWIGRYPRALSALNRLERKLDSLWPLPWFADHFLVEFERV